MFAQPEPVEAFPAETDAQSDSDETVNESQVMVLEE
jgi:hypothetical protein